MKREIKFRAWSGQRMLMNVGVHPHLASDLSAQDDYYKTNEDGRYLVSPSIHGYKIMQYTGIKTISGQEVYEGDIVKYDHEDGPVIAVIVFKESTDEGSMAICGFEYKFIRHDEWGEDEKTFEARVIGNIHENTELLK